MVDLLLMVVALFGWMVPLSAVRLWLRRHEFETWAYNAVGFLGPVVFIAAVWFVLELPGSTRGTPASLASWSLFFGMIIAVLFLLGQADRRT